MIDKSELRVGDTIIVKLKIMRTDNAIGHYANAVTAKGKTKTSNLIFCDDIVSVEKAPRVPVVGMKFRGQKADTIYTILLIEDNFVIYYFRWASTGNLASVTAPLDQVTKWVNENPVEND